VSNILQQNNRQPEDRSINKRLRHKPNFIKLKINEYWENYNTKKYSDFSYASFIEAMDDVKYNKIENHPENFYTIMGIPEPGQYRAFIRLYELVNNDYFAKHPKTFSNHARLPRYPGTLKLLRDIYINYDKDHPVESITISCGSFYRKNLWVREEIIKYLNLLYEKGVKIEISTNCKKNEDKIYKLNPNIHFESLNKRVMIHFILVDDKYIKFYYPHSEKIYHRLGMLLTTEDLNTELLEKKKELFLFFNNLIAEAKNNN
jgi:hypothetical protein